MIDFSRLRTLEQVQAERARLEQDVLRHEQRVQEDICGIQTSWQRRRSIIANILRAIEYLLPKPQPRRTLLGVLGSSLLARLFRRRKS